MKKFSKEGWEIGVRQKTKSAIIWRREFKRVLDNFVDVKRENNGLQAAEAIRTGGSKSLGKWPMQPSVWCSSAFSLKEPEEFLSPTRSEVSRKRLKSREEFLAISKFQGEKKIQIRNCPGRRAWLNGPGFWIWSIMF